MVRNIALMFSAFIVVAFLVQPALAPVNNAGLLGIPLERVRIVVTKPIHELAT
jgi:hypothetical protein